MYILIDMSVYIYLHIHTHIYIYVIMLMLSASLGHKRTQQTFPKSKPPDLQVARREGMMMINRANPFNSSCTRTNLPECLAPQDLNRSQPPMDTQGPKVPSAQSLPCTATKSCLRLWTTKAKTAHKLCSLPTCCQEPVRETRGK